MTGATSCERTSNPQPAQEDGNKCVKYDDQKNRLHDADCCMAPYVIDTPADLKSLIATDQPDNSGKNRRLSHPDNEMLQRDGLFEPRKKFREADPQLAPGNKHPTENSDHVRVDRQQGDGENQRDKPWNHKKVHGLDS